MRSAAATTLARGRHRFGTPGLVHVSAYVTVRRRSLLRALFALRRRRRPAQHAIGRTVPAM